VTLGERIKNQRTRAGLSQERVAELVGVSRQSVTKWESGQSAPSTENLFRLAEIFGTTVDMLLDIPDEKNSKSTDQAQIKELTSQIQYLYRIESARKAEAERVRFENEKRTEELQNKSNKVWLVQILFRYIFGYYNTIRVNSFNPHGLPPAKLRAGSTGDMAA